MTMTTEAPSTLPDQPLPRPKETRFRPLRAGLLNIWEYDDQELWFEDGRIVLRGGNEAGKSKALEVLLPFLFDADMRPQRLDPFGARSKTMRWNLLEFDPERKTALGYTWLEFGRREGGEEEFVTIGAGLRASAQSRDVRSWFFVAGGRPGVDFELSRDRDALGRGQLAEELGERGRVFERATDYREAVDRALFGLGSERYAALIHLLLQLRRPQLSASLDPAELSAVLTESLPPLDEAKIAALSRSFDQLENDAEELRTLSRARGDLDDFLGVYRHYARQQARTRAAEVRSAVTRFDGVTRRVREAMEERDASQKEIETVEREREESDRQSADLAVQLRVLEESDEMRQAGQLANVEEKLGNAERLRRDAEREEAGTKEEAEEARNVADAADADARRMRAEREAAGLAALRAADTAAMRSRHEALREGFEESPIEIAGRLVTAAGSRLGEIRELRQLARELQRAEDQLEREREKEAEEVERAAKAEQAASDASAREEEARDELEREVVAWFASPEILHVPEETVERSVEEALRRAVGKGGLGQVAEQVVAPEVERLRAETDVVRAGIAREDERLADLRQEREEVEARSEVPPPPRAGRAEERDPEVGDAFYRLVDFREGLGEDERRGLEAALDAAGILDAFVTRDGRPLERETRDVVFRPVANPTGCRTVAEALVPVDSILVPEDVVHRLLASLPLLSAGESEPREGDFVALDGRYRVGPLSGRWEKELPEFVGAAAREEARRRRLAELDAAIATVRAALDRLKRRLADLEGRREAIRSAVARFPDGEALRRARIEAVAAAEQVARAQADLAAARDRVGICAKDRDRCRVAVETAARRADLTDYLDDLDGLADRIGEYRESVHQWRESGRMALQLGAVADRDEEAAKRLEARFVAATKRRETAGKEARALRVEAETLRERFGKAAEEIVARRDRVREEIEKIGRRRRELDEAVQEAQKRLGRAESKLEDAESERVTREGERQDAVEAMVRLLAPGILSLALGEDLGSPPPTLTAAIDLARRIEAETSDTGIGREDLDSGANRLHEAFRVLRASLGGDFDPSLGTEDGVTCVVVIHNGRRKGLVELIGDLDAEVEKREKLLEAGERELIERHLLGEVGHHLQERVASARRLVSEMNGELSRHPTNFGREVRIRWTPTEDDPETRAALRVLEKDVRVLSGAEREGLIRFLRDRIGRSREDEGAGSGADRLARVLDYRAWHEFVVVMVEDGRERRLTKRVHGTGSGGSRAVLVHLPLFAAAAAHYRSAVPTAPHLVMLDEAFAGIDPEQRGSLMGLLVAFELDFFLTNHDEWGCYPEVPGVAVYHLERRPGQRGVAALRFVWNGVERKEDDPWLDGRTQEFEW